MAGEGAVKEEDEALLGCKDDDCGVEKDAMERMVAGDDVAEDG